MFHLNPSSMVDYICPPENFYQPTSDKKVSWYGLTILLGRVETDAWLWLHHLLREDLPRWLVKTLKANVFCQAFSLPLCLGLRAHLPLIAQGLRFIENKATIMPGYHSSLVETTLPFVSSQRTSKGVVIFPCSQGSLLRKHCFSGTRIFFSW